MTTNKLAKYREYKQLHIPGFEKEILQFWKDNGIFEQSIINRNGKQEFIFYEGPPSANGTPGIHHVLSRTLKDLFCRYKTMQGFRVNRKGGWDTHGLPVELSVEKLLNITKEDIGKKISVEEYNALCKKQVMTFKHEWEELTSIMGYWVDMNDPYVTYDKNYIETLWHLLKRLHDKQLLYKGFTIQPYSPAAGTGLSSHELNQPGTYKPVKDTTIVAQFRVIKDDHALHPKLFAGNDDVYFLAWTTTPWTLPSNCALAVGKEIHYTQIETFNPYTGKQISVIIANDRIASYFKEENKTHELDEDNKAGWKLVSEFKGKELAGIRYEQLLPFKQPDQGDAFKVVVGDFVSTEDGTGIVHIAPSFGADDFRVAKQNNIGSLTLVDKEGKFINGLGVYQGLELSGRYVKNYKDDADWKNPDVDIAITLKENNGAFKVEKYEHNYPHCWRTDKPVIYYPLDSWFIKTTAAKERLIELNKTINWKPQSTGEGRFGQWLENLVDWNLSRSRFWGTPLPIWRTDDNSEEVCIGSFEQLKQEIEKSIAAGFMKENIDADFDPHRPFVDDIILVSSNGKPMRREPDLIDVWFDSGAMPYAQLHWPFENEKDFHTFFPADFIAEGVDQTRGWFFTLHVIATLISDHVAYKNVVSNGLVLDKNGNKMSKRLGNSVNPFDTIYQYGADTTRWYMITNTQPWDNLKFDFEGMVEVQRKFFGTLYNTYSFFSLYANVDEFNFSEDAVALENRTELDRWILSLLNSLIKDCTAYFNDYEPTQAARAIQDFVSDHLSNWYVRLSRRRFWKQSRLADGAEDSMDKLAAYQTLYTCLETIARLMAPVAPFMSDWLFRNLNEVTGRHEHTSVHLVDFPVYDETVINKSLEEQMEMAQAISSTILALRKKVNIKVRQPLSKALIPVLNESVHQQVEAVEDLIKSEVNIKTIEYIFDTTGIITKKIKPNFKALGPRLGASMKSAATVIAGLGQADIAKLESQGLLPIQVEGNAFELLVGDVEIATEDIPGWLVANAGPVTVALDIKLTPELTDEGNAREVVSQLQKLRKEMDLEITDRIHVRMERISELNSALLNYKAYICAEILADTLDLVDDLPEFQSIQINDTPVKVLIQKS